jgi:hypothetical protein
MARRICLLGTLVGVTTLVCMWPAPSALANASGGGTTRVSALGVPLTVHMTGRAHVTSDPVGIDCTDGAGTCSASFASGTLVTLDATPGIGYSASQLGSCFGLTCMVDIGSSPLVVDAIFSVDSTLWLQITGRGKIRETPLDVSAETGEDGVTVCNIGDWQSPTPNTNCTLRVEPGRRVLLEVVPNAASTFVGWSDPACTDQPTCIVEMPTLPVPARVGDRLQPYDMTVAASFAPIPIGVIAEVVGGGSISSTPPGLACTFAGDSDPARCVGEFAPAVPVTLHAENPLTVHWIPGNCQVVLANPFDCTLLPQASVWVSLSLGTNQIPFRGGDGPEVLVRFRVRKTGSGSGTVSDGGAIRCGSNCVEDDVFGYLSTLIATPDPGSRFAGWHGGGCTSNDANSCTLTVGAATGIIATFEAKTPDPPTSPVTATTPTTTDTTPTRTAVDPGPDVNIQPRVVTPAVIPATVAPATPAFVVRLATASSIRSGGHHTLLVRISTSVRASVLLIMRGPHLLLLRKSYRLQPPKTSLRIQLPPRARPGRYRLTITLTDAQGRSKTLHPTVNVKR